LVNTTNQEPRNNKPKKTQRENKETTDRTTKLSEMAEREMAIRKREMYIAEKETEEMAARSPYQ